MNETTSLRLSVVVPARNEERNLALCLQSLVGQSIDSFLLGRDWELIVVDDASTDRTREIAETIDGVRVLEAPGLDSRVFTGKSNACWFGAEASGGAYVLFTDADTVHEPGELERALEEIRVQNVGLLSYSPRQIVSGFWQRALMPLVFSELASVYSMKDVNDANKRLA
ncbi:MAG: glycosyltransferase family 2 protein, partial [Acidobacteriaceae bacterium]